MYIPDLFYLFLEIRFIFLVWPGECLQSPFIPPQDFSPDSAFSRFNWQTTDRRLLQSSGVAHNHACLIITININDGFRFSKLSTHKTVTSPGFYGANSVRTFTENSQTSAKWVYVCPCTVLKIASKVCNPNVTLSLQQNQSVVFRVSFRNVDEKHKYLLSIRLLNGNIRGD